MTTNVILRCAEVLISLQFLHGGTDVLMHPEERAEKIARLKFPLPLVSVRVNALLMVGAGLLLAAGIFARYAAIILIVCLVLTTIYGHPFWMETGPQRKPHLIHFLKNLGLLGGLLLITLVA